VHSVRIGIADAVRGDETVVEVDAERLFCVIVSSAAGWRGDVSSNAASRTRPH